MGVLSSNTLEQNSYASHPCSSLVPGLSRGRCDALACSYKRAATASLVHRSFYAHMLQEVCIHFLRLEKCRCREACL